MTALKKQKIKISLIVILTLLSFNCYAEDLSIQKGVTTKAEVSDALNKPYITKMIGGKELWFYKDTGNKSFPLLSDKQMLLFIQFNDYGIVEDVGGITESNIPRLIPRSSLQIWKGDRDEKQRLENRARNQVKYGKPYQETRDEKGEAWYYVISKEPTDKQDVYKTTMKEIKFDNYGKFIKERIFDTVAYERALTSEEKAKFDANSILKEARLQTKDATKELIIGDADTAYRRGSAYNDAKQYDKAIPWFKRAVELKPDYGMAYIGLAYAYQETGQEELAIPNYEKGISFEPKFKAVYAPLVFYYMKKENVDRAYKYAKEACQLDPANPGINKVVKGLENTFGKTLTVSIGSTRDEIVRMLGQPATFYKLGAINKDGVPEQLEYLLYSRQNWDVVYNLKNDVVYEIKFKKH
jgi:tetratricopeptide (TPR) repeat protein